MKKRTKNEKEIILKKLIIFKCNLLLIIIKEGPRVTHIKQLL